jgi:hypothetical protein
VSEYLATSPVVARAWCPGCEPLADPLAELLEVRYCDDHIPGRAGSADAAIPADAVMPGSAEAGGESNRAWCDLFHRQLRRSRPPRSP